MNFPPGRQLPVIPCRWRIATWSAPQAIALVTLAHPAEVAGQKVIKTKPILTNGMSANLIDSQDVEAFHAFVITLDRGIEPERIVQVISNFCDQCLNKQ